MMKIFISSVQKEFAKEREALHHHFSTNALLCNFFTPILFEKLPASSQAPNQVYLKEVEASELYLMLLGTQYGFEDNNGLSPTELEYNHAQQLNKDSLAFIKGNNSIKRQPKEKILICKVKETLSYKRFETIEQLLEEVDKACFELLKHKGLVQFKNFDEILHSKATLKTIDQEKVASFIRLARIKRSFPLQEGTPVKKVLTHLNMLENDQLTNSALLAFSKNPQKYFQTAVVKCAQFYGTRVEKPIPALNTISGDVFEQVDQAVEFVLSKLNKSVGTRNKSNQTEFKYEIPREIIAEGIVNAVAHRDYNSNGSVQVRLFTDRLEILNPGHLAPELSIEKLKHDHASYPPNKLLAEALYQAGYIERYGTGTEDIFKLAAEADLKEPLFSLKEGFKVTIWRPNVVGEQVADVNAGVNAGEAAGVKLSTLQKQIVDAINNDAYITQEQLSKKYEKDIRTIQRNIAKLKEKKILRRKGTDKDGVWEVL
ncbi:DUF4062 domain-containing protein [Candidatus Omnitrophota bacterium]